MNISPETWDMIKLIGGAYLVFCLNRSDRNMRELFKRLRVLELTCAKTHGIIGPKVTDDEDS